MKVAISKDTALDYCREAPFHPTEQYPEYPFHNLCPGNRTYEAVRQLLFTLGMDREHFGSKTWNPLGELIKQGDHVVIKPNLVGHQNKAGTLECMIAQGSVIRAVLDYVHIALEGTGKITICDSPQMETDFPAVIRATGIDEIVRFYKSKGVEITVADLRKVEGHVRKIGGVKWNALQGDPMGYRVVDLKGDSEHMDIIDDCGKFRVADYDRHEMLKHHNREKNEYYISGSVLDADVIVSIPKLKTHDKAGMTCALKNLIGINGYKDWLPHHRAGSSEEGGDEYIRQDRRKGIVVRLREEMASTGNMLYILPMRALNVGLILSKMIRPFNDPCIIGAWHGNDTLPRTIVDLNKVLFYADKDGIMRDKPQRRLFILVDGILAGEKEGPMTPEPKHCGVLAAGFNPVAIDAVCSRVMGFDYQKIPTIRYALNPRKYKLFEGRVEDIEIAADRCKNFDGVYDAYNCALTPAHGWIGHIEYDAKRSEKERAAPIPIAAK